MASPRIAVVGGGKMGEAIVAGWLASDVEPAAQITAQNITIVNPGEERRDYLSSTYGVECVADVSGLSDIAAYDVVVLAVKPQIMFDVLAGISSLASQAASPSSSASLLFVSIAAGLSTDSLLAALPDGASLVRVMPNMPLQIAQGASGVCASSASTPEQVEYVRQLFACLGRAVTVDEADMDTVCALSGSGPAYVALMIEVLSNAAAELGMDTELADELALQTVLGTAALIDLTGKSAAEVRESICSPGGTTLAALEAMEAGGFEDALRKGVIAAEKRSKELAQLSKASN